MEILDIIDLFPSEGFERNVKVLYHKETEKLNTPNIWGKTIISSCLERAFIFMNDEDVLMDSNDRGIVDNSLLALFRNGADMNVLNQHLDTPLSSFIKYWLQYKGQPRFFAHLLNICTKYGADWNIRTQKMWTPLHWVSIYRPPNDEDDDITEDDTWIFRFLRIFAIAEHAGVDFNVQDIHGRTPLHLAIMNNNMNMIKAVLEHGASLFIEDVFGLTALDLAIRGTWTEPAFARGLGEYDLKFTPDRPNAELLGFLIILFEENEVGSRLSSHMFKSMIDQQKERKKTLTMSTESISIGIENNIPSERNSSELIVTCLLACPGLGLNGRYPIYELAGEFVSQLMKLVTEKIGILDTRYKCSPLLCGSVEEGTKVGRPNEFDYLFLLEDVHSYIQVLLDRFGLSNEYTYSIFYKLDQHNLGVIRTLIIQRFFDLLLQALSQPLVWKGLPLCSDVPLVCERNVSPLVMTWMGDDEYHGMVITVDILADVKLEQWPKGLIPQECKLFPGHLDQVQCSIVMKRQEINYSVHAIEHRIMAGMPMYPKVAYALFKTMMDCIKLTKCTDDEDDYTCDQYLPTSYALKNALFNSIERMNFRTNTKENKCSVLVNHLDARRDLCGEDIRHIHQIACDVLSSICEEGKITCYLRCNKVLDDCHWTHKGIQKMRALLDR